jgi:hypothetical protein
MNERIRQMVLGLGTFGTGTALLFLNVNPLLLVLTDSVVGVGMLFAAGSITKDDFRIPQKTVSAAGESAATGAPPATPAGEEKPPKGLMASLGKMGGALKPSFVKGKKEQEEEQEKIDLMLDSALVGQSRRIINLAEGGAAAPAATPAALSAALASPGQAGDALGEEGTDIPTQLLEEVTGEDEEEQVAAGLAPGRPALLGAGGFPAVPAVAPGQFTGEEQGDGRADVLQLTDGGLGADDLLSALRLEAMREKKKDDTSLLRNLKGVKVTGRELLDELGTVVREIRGR